MFDTNEHKYLSCHVPIIRFNWNIQFIEHLKVIPNLKTDYGGNEKCFILDERHKSLTPYNVYISEKKCDILLGILPAVPQIMMLVQSNYRDTTTCVCVFELYFNRIRFNWRGGRFYA